jgi:capsular exopolysaccharide synthesis family protein
VSDPTAVRFVESPPRAPAGPALQRAVLGTGDPVSEEYRYLASRVLRLATKRFTTVGIVSAMPGEGKTTVALGLASALARTSPHRVLLVEADLRQPSLKKYLGLPRLAGVAEWLSGRSDSVPVCTISPPGFSVIVAGEQELANAELIGSDRMSALLGACQLSFGFLIVDCPPLSPVADAVALEDLLDGFLLVVRAGTAPREAIEHAIGRLKEGRIHGIVFNDQWETPPTDYSYGRRGRGARRR